jgi:hypothetical protein
LAIYSECPFDVMITIRGSSGFPCPADKRLSRPASSNLSSGR